MCVQPQTATGSLVEDTEPQPQVQLIHEVVVPLLAMQSSVLLCISTLTESTNHYSQFFKACGTSRLRYTPCRRHRCFWLVCADEGCLGRRTVQDDSVQFDL